MHGHPIEMAAILRCQFVYEWRCPIRNEAEVLIDDRNTREQGIYSIGNELDTALREDRIIPAYQKIVDLQTGKKEWY